MKPAVKPLRALLVEDSENDAALVVRALSNGGFELTHERVETAEALREALARAPWDIVISDFSLPRFDGISAIKLLQSEHPDVPVILVSGTIGEETAVNAMKAGARDYLMKDRLTRLGPAVERELAEAQTRKRLRESEEQLRQAQKMESVGHLAGCIAHDFNNILTVILMYCDSLLTLPLEAGPVPKAVEQIRKSGTRAANLTRQLLAFSRRQALEPRVTNLNGILADFEKMLQRLLGERIRLEISLEPDAWNVKVDPGQIEQVIMNLAVNARDAMKDGGKLEIRTANERLGPGEAFLPGMTAEEYVVLSVTDSGHGMTPQVLAKIFDPFFTTKGPEKGTGLGLSTVYGIVQQSGGHIQVKSEPGKGASFRVYLPRANEPLSAPKVTPFTGASVAPVSGTVVLVEDQEDVREIFASALRKNGYNVLTPETPAKALALLETQGPKIRLLISDVVMPEMNGPELALRYEKACPGIGVVLVSGYLADELENYELVKERFLFLQKPFSLEQFLAKVAEGIKRSARAKT